MVLSKNPNADELFRYVGAGGQINGADALNLFEKLELQTLLDAAAALRDQGHGSVITYSRKVFIPLTRLCRDVCHYCTFAESPRQGRPGYLSPQEVLKIARAGAKSGCHEALFTLGDNPEHRYQAARDELDALGFGSTLDYLAHCARLVFDETGLFPHVNPGIMSAADIANLRDVSVSQGIMLESVSERLCQKGGPHWGSPDKDPAKRLATIRLAGEANVPFTTGILIGIGETRRERIDSLLALRTLHDTFGHIQEIIIQNFRPKPDTKMADVPPASLDDLLWTIAVTRILFGPDMNVQAPPNLSPGSLAPLVGAGINDWGGVSPVTPDHVNPEAAWPQVDSLETEMLAAGKTLTKRLAIYPAFVQDGERWVASHFHTSLKQAVDGHGLPRTDPWSPGTLTLPPIAETVSKHAERTRATDSDLGRILGRAVSGETLTETNIVRLFAARGRDFHAVCDAADALRQDLVGDEVSYVVNRNINYTNVCYFHCQFCAFSKGTMSENLRGKPYDIGIDEIKRRTTEGWSRGATEVCMQGGIHPHYTGQQYIDICHAVKSAQPDIHIHAFSPLEIWQGAKTLGLPLEEFLSRLIEVGLGSLPGTAAEILDDEVRAVLCPDKINTQQWLDIMEAAHGVGLRSTATIMYGHIERPVHWARHCLRLLELQKRTGGFTEFVPLPFVHMESPIYLKGGSRRGPTFREAVLMHAVARLVFHAHIPNIQASWVKLGGEGLKTCLNAGVNDVGGTLMDETITRSAGAIHGQEMRPERLESIIRGAGREPRMRTTLYGTPVLEQYNAAFGAPELLPKINAPSRKTETRAAGKYDLVRPDLLLDAS